MLVAALRSYRAPLRASLRAEYGIDLRRPDVSWPDLADLINQLPAGSALWRATGGPLAWPIEMHALIAIEHGIRVLAWQRTEDGHKGRNQPEPIPAPQTDAERQAEADRLESRAAAYRRRNPRAR